MTSRGVGFSLLTLAIYFVANQTRVGWVYLIAAWMVALLLLSWALPHMWARDIRVQRAVRRAGSDNKAPLGEDATAEVTLTLHAGHLSSYFVQVTEICPFEAPGAQRKSFFCPSIGRKATALVYQAACYKRGHYTLPSVEIESRGPFGFFRHRQSAGAPQNVRISPWYLQRDGAQAPPKELQLQEPASSTGASAEVFGTREYLPGDPLRYIHWRSTARRDRLVVKEFEKQRDRGLAFLLDITRDYGAGKDTTLEYSVKLGASLARYAFDQGIPFRLLAHGAPRGIATWQGVLDYLTDVQASAGATSLSGLGSQVAPEEDLVIAAPVLKEALLAPLLAHLRRARIIAVEFRGFEADGLPSASIVLPGVQTVPWSKGAPPAEAVTQLIVALDEARTPARRPS